jgi:chromosome segregation ATPase
MADTPLGETVTPVAPSNEPGNAPAPVTDNSGADVEQAKREAEQARIRANQLQNQLDKIQKEQEAAQQKQLEEKEEFKTLYEQTQSRLKEIEDAQTAQERQKELATATEAVFKDYSANVVEVAKTAGLSLSDDSEAAQAMLKEKLDAIQKQVGSSTPRPTANNPHDPAPQVASRQELTRRDADGVSPMALAGAKGDDRVIKQYIRDLPAIQRMREIAQRGA